MTRAESKQVPRSNLQRFLHSFFGGAPGRGAQLRSPALPPLGNRAGALHAGRRAMGMAELAHVCHHRFATTLRQCHHH